MNQIEECCPGENLFLLLSGNRKFNLIESGYRDKILFKEDLLSIDFKNIDGIIVHYLSIAKAKLLRGIPINIPVACSIWGGDFYNFLPEFRQNLYSDLTKEYLNHTQRGPRFYYLLKDKIVFPISHNYRLWKKVIDRSKMFSTVIPYERNQIERYFSSDTKYLPLPTHSLEKVIDIDDYEKSICTKGNFLKNVLLGNSGHLSNNHLEILHFLKKFENKDINIHVPLTYGNNNYIKHICKSGSSLFGGKFFPILNHLNNSDYLNFLNCFNIFIFNNYRQQGIGTITKALWSGGKVFLSNKNVTSSFYRDSGLKVFSIENDLLKSSSLEFFKPLTSEEILTNRKGLLNLYSNETVNNSIRFFFEYLRKKL
jgi:hypothetical protein